MLSHPHVDAGEACRTDVLYHKLVVEAEYFYLEPPFFLRPLSMDPQLVHIFPSSLHRYLEF
jgi:hypothetical protein